MLLEPQKKGLMIAGCVLIVLLGAGLLVYNIRKGAAPEEIIVEAPPQVTQAEIVTLNQNGSNFIFEQGGKAVATLPVTPGMKTAVPLRQVGRYAYFKTMPEGGDGYILFGSSSPQVIRIDVRDGSVAILKHDGRRIEDISPNGQFMAWTEYKENGDKSIIIETIADHSEKSYPVERKYSQFGDALFSPDSSKLAFAVAIGFPGKESGQVGVINLKDGTSKTVATASQSNTYFRVRGWRANGDVDSVLVTGDSTDFKMK